MTNKNFDHTHFFNFEKKHDLFNNKIGKLFFWDVIRFDIYYKLLFDSFDENNNKPKSLQSKVHILKSVYSFFVFILFKKCDYLFFTTSRNKDKQSKYFDQNLEDILCEFPNNSFLFESFEKEGAKLLHKNILFNPIYVFRKVFKVFFGTYKFSNLIDTIKLEYNECNLNNQDVNNLISNFKIDYNYYSIVFKLKKPKIIFVTQNGIQKGLFAAAKRYNIPTVEVQHGIIDEGHLAYNYSKEIEYREGQLILPTYFFSFSSFWTNDLFFPVKEIVSVGNNYFYNQTEEKNTLKVEVDGLLVASSGVFGENLKNLTLELAQRTSEVPLYFKLHPSQFCDKEYYINAFEKFNNVSVYTNEKSIGDLLQISKAILVIQSTALYEAYHVKKTGIIYKKQTYKRNRHVFDLPNIFLANNADEVIVALENRFVEQEKYRDLFFKKFDLNLFNEFVKKIS